MPHLLRVPSLSFFLFGVVKDTGIILLISTLLIPREVLGMS